MVNSRDMRENSPRLGGKRANRLRTNLVGAGAPTARIRDVFRGGRLPTASLFRRYAPYEDVAPYNVRGTPHRFVGNRTNP